MAKYEMVIGLEVHAELKTNSKIFCGCLTKFDAEPNTQCCPVCMGLPGSLPVLNRRVVELAVQAGVATNCEIARFSRQDRKNYFYPDLPKAYQISQFDLPLCERGHIDIGDKRIGITRIHIEEDAGKLLHTASGDTLIDLNRCGVPLIEIVSEPDIRSVEEARAYLAKLRAILVAADISDCKMEEGSLRCDVNLSVRHTGDERMGTRTEMKNLNSFNNIVKAIESEYARQVEVLEAGDEIVQETRRFDAASGTTSAMRSKENADDYRYFPDPDLPPISLSEDWIDRLASELPELPDALKQRLVDEYGFLEREAAHLSAAPRLCASFESAWARAEKKEALKALVVSHLSRADEDPEVRAEALLSVAEMLDAGELHMGGATKVLTEVMRTGESPEAAVERLQLRQIADRTKLFEIVTRVVEENEPLCASYRMGKQNAMKGLMGAVMRVTGGRANPGIAETLLKELLEQ